MKRKVIIPLGILFYALLLAGSFAFWVGVNCFTPTGILGNCPQFPLKNAPADNNQDTITLLFAGDIMLDRGVEFYAAQHNSWKWPFLRIANTLQEADLAFGNLESVISDKGQNFGSIYSFRADPRTLEGLAFAGFDMLSVANNHSLDYGIEAFVDSASRLKQAGITPVGIELFSAIAQNNSWLEIQKIKGTKFGFLAYTNAGSPLWQATQTTPGVAWVDQYIIEEFQNAIRAAKQQSDILVVSIHFGEEYQTQPNEAQKLIAKSAIDAGADIVVGHHPHVVQPVERYKQGWIAYGLGNFVFDQGFSKETMEGVLLEVVIQDKKITRVLPRTVYLNSEFQPSLLTQ